MEVNNRAEIVFEEQHEISHRNSFALRKRVLSSELLITRIVATAKLIQSELEVIVSIYIHSSLLTDNYILCFNWTNKA